MSAKFILTFVLMLSIQYARAQPEIAFQQNYGGSGTDVAYSMKQTIDGGFVMAGFVLSGGGDVMNHISQRDFWVVKTNVLGEIEWEKTYGGNNYETAYSIDQTSDNGYIVAGLTASADGDITEAFGYEDIWVIKLDANGNLQWQKSYGSSENERVWEIQQTTDGGYVMAGYGWFSDLDNSYVNYYVIKIDAMGTIEWQKNFGYSNLTVGNNGSDYAKSIKQTSDGGYIVVGDTIVLEDVGNTSDYWIVKLDHLGNIVWHTRLGGSLVDEAWHVVEANDGGYVVAGFSSSNDLEVTGNQGGYDFWIVKLSSNGDLLWQKTLGGSGSDRAYSIIQSDDGNYIVVGYTDSDDGDVSVAHGELDGWVVKLNNSGELLWEQTYGGSGLDGLRSIAQTSSDAYAICGGTSSENLGLELNGGSDFYLLSLENETLNVNSYSNPSKVTVYPNPVSKTLFISTDAILKSVAIYDVFGKQIYSSKSENQINVSPYQDGIYMLKINTSKGFFTKKIIIN